MGEIFIQGEYAYVGPKLVIWDISEPPHPRQVGSLLLPLPLQAAQDIKVAGDVALVITPKAGLRVVDVSEPTAPTEVGFYETSGIVLAVAVSGHIAYLVEKGKGLRVLDLSKPASPVEVGHLARANIWDVAVADGYAYLAADKAGLRVIDVSDPTAPTEVSYFNRAGRSIYVANGYAYVSNWEVLHIVDISDPMAPIRVSRTTGLDASDVAVTDDYVYIANHWAGLVVLDISNPAAPKRDHYYGVVYAQSVAVVGNYLYLVDWEGLQVLDVSAVPTAPSKVGFVSTRWQGLTVAVEGNIAVVTQGEDGPAGSIWGALGIVDVSEPTQPMVVGSYETRHIATDVVLKNGDAYVTDAQCELCSASCWRNLYLLDLSDLGHIRLPLQGLPLQDTDSSQNTSWFGHGVAVVDHYAYVVGSPYNFNPDRWGRADATSMDRYQA